MISVIIPAYNAAKTITQTIDSVLNQTYKDLEILIINDGSTDNTLQVLSKIEADINAEKKTKITIITTQNKGVSHARNLGFNHSKGKYIQYLDADDLLIPEKLYIQYQALEYYKGDIAYGNWQRFKEINYQITLTETIERQITGDPEIEIFTHFWCPPAVILYSRSIAEKISWNVNLPVIQDARYLLDAVRYSGKLVYCDHLMALYREGQSQSLSQKNDLAFVKDVLTNCLEIYDHWKSDINTTSKKRKALITVLRYCINQLSSLNKELFHDALEQLLRIDPHYIPEEKGILRMMSQLIGYKNAEKLAAIKRRINR
ncbi:MAG: glycosyltransferase family 2 protein [Pedobacter sp.]|nr:MAG: glycosyltransferase family 2 protein [Pedobacter sp.]